MIRYLQGDIFASGAEALVNPVNCVGVMGKGLALKFKTEFPENFRLYKAACDAGRVQPGAMFIVEDKAAAPRWIVNFPTKRHWRCKSRLEDVAIGLKALAKEIDTRGISSIALPALGAGLGGLDWPEVKALIEVELSGIENADVLVFEPRE